MKGLVGTQVCTLAVLLLLASALLVARPVVGLPAGSVLTTTEHFEIWSGSPTPRHLETVLEQFYSQLVGFFGVEPDRRLKVMIFDSRPEFGQGVSGGESLPGPLRDLGGLYSASEQTAYTWVRSSESRTRESLLHEVTHAFHDAVSASGRFPADWYIEGVAEYLESHCWDGTDLITGIAPGIGKANWGAEALAFFAERDWDLGSVLFRTDGYGRGASWAVVHFLATHYPSKLRELGATVEEPETAWRKVFGDEMSAEFVQDFRRHLLEVQQPWTVISGHWDGCGGVITGHSDGLGVAVLRQTPTAFTIEVLEASGGGQAGLVAEFQSPDDHSRVTQLPGGPLILERVEMGQLSEIELLRLPGDKSIRVSKFGTKVKGAKLKIFVEGKRVATLPALGQVGIAVQGGTSSFRVCTGNSSETCSGQ